MLRDITGFGIWKLEGGWLSADINNEQTGGSAVRVNSVLERAIQRQRWENMNMDDQQDHEHKYENTYSESL